MILLPGRRSVVAPSAGVTAFRREPLVEIVRWMQSQLAAGATTVELSVLDPDRGRGCYAGELVEDHVHRPWRVWIELADRLGLRMLTPHVAPPLVRLRFEPLDPRERLHAAAADPTERYGAGSPFARISKHEEPGFTLDLADAIERTGLGAGTGARVLDLGVNTGDELALLRDLGLRDAHFVGIDHSASAIATARGRFPDATLHVADLHSLEALGLGRFELVVSIGTLQSPGIDDREVVRRIVQHHLAPAGSVILGFPNCRYLDGELAHGTRMKNFRQPELGLLVKDAAFYRKYLQQHGKQVFVTGQHYLLVTGVPVTEGDPR